MSVNQFGADGRIGDFRPHGYIGRAANYCFRPAAQIKRHQMQTVGIGMGIYFQDLTDENPFPIGADDIGALDFNTSQRQTVGNFCHR